MTTVFDEFKKELTELCKKHKVVLFSSEYDALCVWLVEADNEIDNEMAQLLDRTSN